MPTVYTGRVFSVSVEAVRFPDGALRDVAVVRHPPSVVLLPLRGDGQVVLIRQFRASVNRWLWELPAGSVDPGETPEGAAVRECIEEIGLAPRRLERLRALYPTPGFCDEELIFFRAWDLHHPEPGTGRGPDDDERIEPRAFDPAEARAMVERGEIVDLKTAYGLTLI
jgi:ADP-ribose pyrophosphatase